MPGRAQGMREGETGDQEVRNEAIYTKCSDTLLKYAASFRLVLKWEDKMLVIDIITKE